MGTYIITYLLYFSNDYAEVQNIKIKANDINMAMEIFIWEMGRKNLHPNNIEVTKIRTETKAKKQGITTIGEYIN